MERMSSTYHLMSRMWHPHIMVTNSVDVDKLLVTPLNNRLLVRYDGDVLLHGPAFLKTTCSTNLTKYPFDHQVSAGN
ncbi:neuronal acetylcholine receptor subunit beta-4 [Biomphalaria pfeifferi]|uniref:Neuronal acetylcholine receptor subunit beta-4 n=1 Tax=Biomphalaria pfeifferi TaxID=112525 RepID=A0AAD8F7F1_BIOPF|nr:neuronal acetylcholine receptor subunit beta-4 [Biomphalaria pfeifferi]